MSKLRIALSLVGCMAVGLALQQPGTIPPTDDASHPGQPAWCQNYDDGPDSTSPKKHNCECIGMNDTTCDKSQQESNKCKVYCRKTACKCKTACQTARAKSSRRIADGE